ncbi:hypothetical protein KO500_00035 [Cellulophaga baltica]|uniref:hypothetical protein n=1 Tax=Cellulophaga TaxID=104264 RepID=UPI001C07BCE1|nr:MULTISPECIES: hypothetical protein [Cellulophaga]MBU2994802.1 hypothetical protein [Cellulophaga baltica]MDO6766197.1 hypothetical protein [Cellulophaga sp. 1_MG-2023]
MDKLSDLKENANFYIALGISLIISLLITLHPSNLETLNELGNLKWIMVMAGIVGMTGLSIVGIFGYVLLIVYSIPSIKRKIKEKQISSIFGTIFQFFMIVAMTWPIPMLVIKSFAKLYFNYTFPDFF